jgi:hypothetical protein
LDGPFPNLWPVILTSNQDGRQAKNGKKGVKLSSAVAAILVSVLKCRTQFWNRTTQESFQQSLVEIGSVVSEKDFFLNFILPFF